MEPKGVEEKVFLPDILNFGLLIRITSAFKADQHPGPSPEQRMTPDSPLGAVNVQPGRGISGFLGEAAGKGPQNPQVFPGGFCSFRARSGWFLDDGETLQVLTQMLTEAGKQIEHRERHAHSVGLSVSSWRHSEV